MTSHEHRVAKLVEIIRKSVPADPFKAPNRGWRELTLSRIGPVAIHSMPPEAAKVLGCNETWVRIGTMAQHSDELRGSAETVAKELCGLLKAPSKAVAAAVDVLLGMKFDGLHAPEVAAMKGLDEMTTYRAFDLLEERGVVRRDPRGYFRV